MTDDRERITSAYKRAGVGLALGALLWIAALVFAGHPEDRITTWFIPIGAAALSILCFARYKQYRQ